MKKGMKIFLLVIAVVIILLATIFSIKFVRVNKIIKSQIGNLDVNNYYMKLISNDDRIETYRKDEKFYTKNGTWRFLVDEKDDETLLINDDKKIVYKLSMEQLSVPEDGFENLITKKSNSFSDKLSYVFKWKIDVVTRDDVKCYHIKLENNDEIWIDKDTMLVKEYIEHDSDSGYVTNVKYEKIELNKVSDKDFELTDIDEYEVVDK